MPRRIHVAALSVGDVPLSQEQAHHLRNVLRMTGGEAVELFTDDGSIGTGSITHCDDNRVVVRVKSVRQTTAVAKITIASAIPKRDRADWMVEKLSEIGVARFIPLITDRSIVAPEGKNKLDRWKRIAVESAKQSQRPGVMQIDEPTNLKSAIKILESALVLSTQGEPVPIQSALRAPHSALLIGPEGGWSEAELAMFDANGLTAVTLTTTILRVETAAVLAAGLAVVLSGRPD